MGTFKYLKIINVEQKSSVSGIGAKVELLQVINRSFLFRLLGRILSLFAF
jgi:hypothetical protein